MKLSDYVIRWGKDRPDHAFLSLDGKTITYGEAVGYLLENDPGYEWYVNADNNSIDVEGSYITFNYTMGIADEPTICHFHLSFTKDSNGEWVPSYSGDECDSTDTFMECMYGYYYQGNQ